MSTIQAAQNEATPSVAIVAAEWNDFIVTKLITGAQEVLSNYGIKPDTVPVYRCPGSFEIPLTAQHVIRSTDVRAVICLGVVIKGDTAHFEYVSEPLAHGLMSVSLETGVPCIFGVLTTYTMEQALERAGGSFGNKGAEAAETALRMISLLRSASVSSQ
jgi:6,7-dimethyl-8-ribityllumazine synthase